MSERMEMLKLGTTTADANDIIISYKNQHVLLEYKDYNRNINQITFNEVIAFNFK